MTLHELYKLLEVTQHELYRLLTRVVQAVKSNITQCLKTVNMSCTSVLFQYPIPFQITNQELELELNVYHVLSTCTSTIVFIYCPAENSVESTSLNRLLLVLADLHVCIGPWFSLF